MTDVFPPRDLPDLAIDWGRKVESRVKSENTRLSQTRQTFENGARFVGGQLAVLSNQVDEQFNRTTLAEFPANLSATGNATIEPFPRANRTITFNPPGGARIAQVEIYVNHSNTNFGVANVFAYLSYAGGIISKLRWTRDTDAVDAISADPAPQVGSGLAFVALPETGPATFTLTLVRVGFTGTTTTETLTNIRAYLTPYQSTI